MEIDEFFIYQKDSKIKAILLTVLLYTLAVVSFGALIYTTNQALSEVSDTQETCRKIIEEGIAPEIPILVPAPPDDDIPDI